MSLQTQTVVIQQPTVYVAQPSCMFPVHVTWNSKFKTFPMFQWLIVRHLLQAGCGYLTDDNVVHEFQAQGESYYKSTEFQD